MPTITPTIYNLYHALTSKFYINIPSNLLKIFMQPHLLTTNMSHIAINATSHAH